MKKQLLIALSVFLANTLSAQISMSDALKIMPSSMVPYLTENNRLDCIDFYEAGMKAEVRNALDGKSELLQLTDHYATFRLNEAVEMELALLNANDRQLICMISTYGKDIRESYIAFFDTTWKQLSTSDYIDLPHQMFTSKFNPEDSSLTIVCRTTLDRPANEEQEEIKEVQMNLKWNGEMFK